MTQDDIISMAKEAGFDPHDMSDDFTCNLMDIERFAVLVISSHQPQSSMSWQEGYEIGVATEREACAKVADAYEPRCDSCPSGVVNAIRARGRDD